MKKIIIFLLSFTFIHTISSCSNSVLEENTISSLSTEKYTVKVRPAASNKAWQTLNISKAKIDLHDIRTTYFTQFDMAEPVEVMVVCNEKVKKVRIRPTSKGIGYSQKGNSIYFSLDVPTYLSIEINDDRFGNLQLFADQPKERVDTRDNGVMYFGPGVYSDTEPIKVPSNTTVYLDSGAIVKTSFDIQRVKDVRIIGRGIIQNAQRGINIEHSSNIYIEGITIVNPEHYSVMIGESSNVRVENLKSFSSQIWSDGIDMMSCSDVTINNVYMRNSDDCIAIYGHRWDFFGDSRNIEVLNSILWADNAHPINIGTHGDIDSEIGDVLESFTFKNIDILEHHEKTPIYQGCFAVTCGDNITVRNLLFEDIRIENIEEGKLFYLAVQQNSDFNMVAGNTIENVVIKDIIYKTEYPRLNKVGKSVIQGFSPTRVVRNITLDNVMINGNKISMKDIITNEYVEGIHLN